MTVYDAIILLTGEDTETRPRSNRAKELFDTGKFGHILITGGYGGFKENPLPVPEATDTAAYLLEKGIPVEKIFTDPRPRDTFGNLTYLEADPFDGNPRPSEIGFMLLTEKAHMPRALDLSRKVWEPRTFDYDNQAVGTHTPGLFTRVYSKAMLHAMREIDAEPEAAHTWLLENHPFYQEGWFDKPVRQRKLEAILKGMTWFLK